MPLIQSIPVTLDRLRHLRIDNRALVKAEQAIAKVWGEKRFSLIKAFQENALGMTELSHLFWAGLLHEDPALSYDGALALMTNLDMNAMSRVIADALKEQVGVADAPDGVPVDPPQPGTPPNGTGSPSGPPPGTTSA